MTDDTFVEPYVGWDNQPPPLPPPPGTPSPPATVNNKGGYQFPVSDRPHLAALGGTVEAKYGTLTAQAVVPVEQAVKLHISIPSAAAALTDSTKVENHVRLVREMYAQVGIRIDFPGPNNLAAGVGPNLANGTRVYNGYRPEEFDDRHGLMMSPTELQLLGLAGRTDQLVSAPSYRYTAEVFYAPDLHSLNATGEKLPSHGHAWSALPNPYASYSYTALIDADEEFYSSTLAHEFGHILGLDHFGHDPEGYVSPVEKTNLMARGGRDGGFDDEGSLTGSRRLTYAQGQRMRQTIRDSLN